MTPKTDAKLPFSEVETERRNRIRLSLMAYGYEIVGRPIATDAEFDALAAKIQPDIETGNSKLDVFFQAEFQPHTGMWIHSHPEISQLAVRFSELEKRRASSNV